MVQRLRPRSTRLLLIGLVCASLLIITLDYRQGDGGPLAAVGGVAKSIMAPLQNVVSTVTRPISDTISGIVHLPSLSRENRELQDRVKELEGQQASVSSLQRQLEELTATLGLRDSLAPESVTAAAVIAGSASNFERTVRIDKGSSAGVEMNAPVVTGTAEAPLLVGHVVDVGRSWADVQLIIDRSARVSAVLETSELDGVISGRGDGDMRMDGLEEATEAEGDERVFTLSYDVGGISSLYPPGLLIGTVSRVAPAEDGLPSVVEIRPAVDFSTLQAVVVLSSRDGQGEETDDGSEVVPEETPR